MTGEIWLGCIVIGLFIFITTSAIILSYPYKEYHEKIYKNNNFWFRITFILQYWKSVDEYTYPNLTVLGKIFYFIFFTVARVLLFIGNFIINIFTTAIPKLFKALFIKNKEK